MVSLIGIWAGSKQQNRTESQTHAHLVSMGSPWACQTKSEVFFQHFHKISPFPVEVEYIGPFFC